MRSNYEYADTLYIQNLFDSLDQNKFLEKISLKNSSEKLEGYQQNLVHLYLFKASFFLKCINLLDIKFDHTSMKNFCNYLSDSELLEELQVNESIMIYSQDFFNAININRSLKILAIKPHINANDGSLRINALEFGQIISNIKNTLIEDLSIMVSIFNNNNNESINKSLYEYNSAITILKYLLFFLASSGIKRKIIIAIPKIHIKFSQSLADFIIKLICVKKNEYFAGYNLEMLINNKIDILELKDKL